MSSNSKIKVGWIAPCIGIGGADAFMLSLIKNTHNLEHVGVAIGDQTKIEQLQWAQNMVGQTVPFYQLDHGLTQLKGVKYDRVFSNVVWNACHEADVIITWCMPNVPSHLLSLDKPVVELVQNCDTYAKEILASNRPDFTVAVSNAVAAICDKPDAVIYNAADPNRCTPKWGREITREQWGLSEEDKVILFAGRFVDEKWPQAPIQALQHLDKNWKVVFAGRGYRDTDLINEAQRYHVQDRVFFHPPVYDMGDLFAASDVFILPSDFEGLPLTMIEAWLAGIPVVTTDMDVMLELRATFGDLATYVPRRCTSEVLANALQVIDLSIVANAREIAWKYLTIGTVSLQWEHFLNEALSRWRRRKSELRLTPILPMEPMQSSKAFIRKIELQDNAGLAKNL